MSQFGSSALDGLLASLRQNALMKAAAIAADAADMTPPEQGPPGMMPGAPAPGGTMSQELRAQADQSPDVSEKQVLTAAADRFDMLAQLNAPMEMQPQQAQPPQQGAPEQSNEPFPEEAAAQQPAPMEQGAPQKTASVRKNILDEDGGLADIAPGQFTPKTAGEEVSAEELNGWLSS